MLSAVLGAIAALLVAIVVVPGSYADRDHDLRHRRHGVNQQIHQQRGDLDEVSKRLVVASGRVDIASSNLQAARAHLSDLRDQVAAAARYDLLMQHRLEVAVHRLEVARRDLAAGHRAVRSQRRDVVASAIADFQTGQDGQFTIVDAFDATSARDTVGVIQAGQVAVDQNSYELQQLQANQVLLRLTATRVERAKEEVAATRRKAAENLALKRELEQEAEVARDAVAKRLDDLRGDQRELAAAKRVEAGRLHNLEAERHRLSAQLEALARRRARAHHASVSSHPSGGGFLGYPANGPITSPYGMRMHPILHIWKLHDGTDFGVPCGTPVVAAATGTVSAEYYNSGYGNRVVLDHGWVHGVSLATSYNHLTSFAAHVGQHVNRGQVIAYSGTTGYSTGCHLHFMVYVNGGTVDPVSWL